MSNFQKERDAVVSALLDKKWETLTTIIERYEGYTAEWRAKGRIKEAEAMENIIALLRDGKIHDPRLTREGEPK